MCIYINYKLYIHMLYILYIHTSAILLCRDSSFFFGGGFKIIAVCDVSSTSRLYYLVHCPVEPGQF